MPATKQSLTMTGIEHGVVMAHAGADRIPAGTETAKHYGMRSQHYGWPGLAIAKDGTVLAVASERVRHIDPFGRDVIARSNDGGRTWSKPEVFFESNTDDRDAAVCVLPNGTVVATWFSSDHWLTRDVDMARWAAQREAVTADTLTALSRGWLRRSHDGGKTWEHRIYPTIIGLHAGPAVLADGSMIYCGPYEDERFIATKSTDGGKTWGIVGEIPMPLVKVSDVRERPAFNENHCLEVEPGHILCVLRATNEPRDISISESFDGGLTWSQTRSLGIYGFPSSLLKLSSGAILCVFGDRREPRAIRGIISYDNGATWDIENALLIREFEHKADMGYPMAVEISPGEILCVYYYVPFPGPGVKDPATELLDPATVGILSTRFCLK